MSTAHCAMLLSRSLIEFLPPITPQQRTEQYHVCPKQYVLAYRAREVKRGAAKTATPSSLERRSGTARPGDRVAYGPA